MRSASWPSEAATLEQVAALVLAHKLEKDTKTPAPVFYGLLRQDMPSDVTALHAANPNARLSALQVSSLANKAQFRKRSAARRSRTISRTLCPRLRASCRACWAAFSIRASLTPSLISTSRTVKVPTPFGIRSRQTRPGPTARRS